MTNSKNDQVVYTSRVRIVREKGPQRLAYLPSEKEPVHFGVHSEIAQHYKVSPDAFPPHATTIDYIVAAAAGWLTGTFGGALEARKINAASGNLESEATGEVELENNVLILRRINVIYKLRAEETQREVIDRVHSLHADHCPVARSLKGAIEIRTQVEIVP